MNVLRNITLTTFFLLFFDSTYANNITIRMPHPCSLQNSQMKCENHISPTCFWNHDKKRCEGVDYQNGCVSYDWYVCTRVEQCSWSEREGRCEDR